MGFTIGQRVRVVKEIEDSDVVMGLIGTVRSYRGCYYGIEFDNPFGAGWDLEGFAEHNRGWYVTGEALVPAESYIIAKILKAYEHGS